MADYNKVGLLVIREDRILLCRKRGLSRLILPGGTLGAGRDARRRACTARSVMSWAMSSRAIWVSRHHRDRAASDDPSVVKTVEIQLYRGEITGRPVASPRSRRSSSSAVSDREELSPILIHSILPDLARRGSAGVG